MSGVEVYFMGGPADGQYRVVPANEAGWPAETFTVSTITNGEVGSFTYLRQASQSDSGPLWVYVPYSDEQEPSS